MQENDEAVRGHDPQGPAAPKREAGSSDRQLRATTAAKDVRLKAAGLGGKRTSEVTATVKRAQAQRDAATGAIPETKGPSQEAQDPNHPQEHPIQVQVNTGHSIHGSDELNLYVQDTVIASLGRFDRQVTRVEIHLSDDNGSKSRGDDKRCVLEARPAGHQPLVVTHVGATLDEAVDGAVDMMEKLLDRTFEKLYDPKGNTSIGEDMTP